MLRVMSLVKGVTVVEGEGQGSCGPESTMHRLARASRSVYTCVGMGGMGYCWVKFCQPAILVPSIHFTHPTSPPKQ